MKTILCSLMFILSLLAIGCDSFSVPPPTGLLCELLEAPQTTMITDAKPEFSWIVNSHKNSDFQTAYEIMLASSPEYIHSKAPDLWMSGKIISNQSTAVTYAGKSLKSDSSYYWAVRTWNQKDQPSSFSDIQQFNTGELTETYKPGNNQWLKIKNLPGQPWALENRHNIESNEFAPVRFVEKAAGHYFIDFGLARFATLKFDAAWLGKSSESVPADVQVQLGELASADDSVEMNPPSPYIIHETHSMSLMPDRQTYTLQLPRHKSTFKKRAVYLPEHLHEVTPFRYAEIIGVPGLKITDVRQSALNYRFNDNAARFHCSEPVLNEIWQLCKHTIKACSFLGTYIDGNRERRPYEADTFINQLGHYGVDREFAMARHSGEYLITHPNWPTEYNMLSVFIAWNDYVYTADTDSLRACYDDLKVKTLVDTARPDGLIAAQGEDISHVEHEDFEVKPSPFITDELLNRLHMTQSLRDLVDWPPQPQYRDNFEFKRINTAVNAYHYHALVTMARIAQTLNNVPDAQYYEHRADSFKHIFNEKLFDRSQQLYIDGEGSSHASFHANFFPLAFGLVPEDRQKHVINFIRSKNMRCGVYTAYFLLEALYNTDQADHAYALLAATTDTSWYNMIRMGSTMTTEAWDVSQMEGCRVSNIDFNHPWAAAPAGIIPRYLMGIRPLEPGFGKILIHPQPGPLEEASLDLPTIKGPLHVDFKQVPGKSFILDITIPANTTARIVLPRLCRDDAIVLVNGKRCQAQTEGNTLVLDNIPSGTHRFIRN